MDGQDFTYTPDWARDAVFYQIFPDRFAIAEDTDGAEAEPVPAGDDLSVALGGNIPGITAKLGYLNDLGVNAIYLNPVFQSQSYHAYDTTDYEKVDPRFGTEKSLIRMVAKAHEFGMRVIFDGVFNHCGDGHPAFQDVLEKGEESQFKDWFFVKSFPINQEERNYETFGDFGGMPKWNLNNSDCRNYIIGSVLAWIEKTRVDGWRLDVSDELDPDFLREFRERVREISPDTYIVGENWKPAGEYLQGDMLDATMNYPWRGVVLEFFAKGQISVSEFEGRLADLRNQYRLDASAVEFNLLGSHDAERLRLACGDQLWRERQAILFQMMYPGTPCIYYGEEIGMIAGTDPDNRYPMLWNPEQWDSDLLSFYQIVLATRRDHNCLRRGIYEPLVVDDENCIFGFMRTDENERVLVLFNQSDEAQTVGISTEALGEAELHDWLGTDIAIERQDDCWLIHLPEHDFALIGA